MKTVMAFGSFDIVHEGHKAYLQEAKSFGNHLIVVVARDSNIEKFKGRKPMHHEMERLMHVAELEMVDKAVLGHPDDILEVIEEYKPSILCLGYDQKTIDDKTLEKELQRRKVKAIIVRAKPFQPEKYKSSKFRIN